MKTLASFRSKLLALTLAIMASVSSFAYEFEYSNDFHIDGFAYKVLPSNTLWPYGAVALIEIADCAADVIIPDTITYTFSNTTVTYIVTTLGGGAALFTNSAKETVKSISIPKGISVINSPLFAGCSNLTSIVVDSENPYYDSRENCNAIITTSQNPYFTPNTLIAGCQTTVIPHSVAEIADKAFYNSALESITIPTGVTKIGRSAFNNSNQLSSVTLPATLTAIGDWAFDDCNNLTEVICYAPQPPTISKYTFSDISPTVYVPENTVTIYQNAPYWMTFDIQPIQPSYKSQWCNQWNILEYNVSGMGIPEETWRYYLAEDITINGTTYTTVNRYWTADKTKCESVATIRFTENQKVYALLGDTEYLVYDFSVQVGDTIETIVGVNYGTMLQQLLVHQIDIAMPTGPKTITLYPICKMEDGECDDCDEDGHYLWECCPIEWIEGIGSTDGFLMGYPPCGHVGGIGHNLLCAYKDDELKYTGDLYDEYGCEYNAEQKPKDLFPTLWGLQRTTCLKNINENEVGTVWGSSSYLMQEIETTTIDGKQYLLFGTNNTYDEYWSLWLREENNKILVYSAAQKKDLVLYDFTLNVGDSLLRLYVDEELSSIVDYYKYEADWEYTKPLFVTEVSTITLLDGKEYKKWTFDNGMEYVEGIGCFGTSYAWNDFYQLIANGPLYSDVFSQHLVCASKNGQLLYKMDESEMAQLETECLCEAENPEDLFPTLWGLQQTICSGYYGEEGDEWASGLTGPSQEITMMDGKPYLQWGSWYLREENDKILVYSEIQKKDLVLYDFTLELGDTMTTLNLVTPEFLEYEGIVGIVDYPLSDYDYTYPIDTLVVTELSKETLLDGKEYTRWKFSDGTVYVEGIGSMSETFFHHIADHLPVPVSYLGSYLVCVSKNNKLLYQMDDAEMERLGAECMCEYDSGPRKDNAKNGKIGGRPTPTQWNMLEVETKEMDGTPTILRAETFSYTLENDSIVANNKTFYQLARQSTKDTAITKSFVGALHFGKDEDNRVYFLRDGVEYVLYDFTAEIGDTVEIFAGINNYPQETTYTHVVVDKDTTEDGACRMFLEVVFPDETTAENAEKVWLAGLGSVDGIVHNAASRATKARSSETQTSVMLCAWRDDNCLYTTNNPEYDTFGCVYNQDPTAVEDVQTSGDKYQKIIRDGHLYILRDDKIYDVLGTPMN